MPVSKITLKTTVLDLELDNVELTVGPEIMKIGRLKASVDIADLLRVRLPELMEGTATGVMLLSHGEKMKIQCIKEIRSMTGWGLVDSKAFVEDAPILLKAEDLEMTPDEPFAKTKEAARRLEEQGATVEITYGTERIPTVLDRFREMVVEALGAQVSSGKSDE